MSRLGRWRDRIAAGDSWPPVLPGFARFSRDGGVEIGRRAEFGVEYENGSARADDVATRGARWPRLR